MKIMLVSGLVLAAATFVTPALAATPDSCTQIKGGVWAVYLERSGMAATEAWDVRGGFAGAPAFNNIVPAPYATGHDNPHSNSFTDCTVTPRGIAQIAAKIQGEKIYSVQVSVDGAKATVIGINSEAGWTGTAVKVK